MNWGHSNIRRAAVVLLGLARAWVAASEAAPVADASRPLRVLVVYSDERLLPANIVIDETIRTTIAEGAGRPVEFYSEFLDVARFTGEAQQRRQRDFFRDKYQERPPDLVMATGEPAVAFLRKYRTELFAGTPIVHCAMAGEDLPGNLAEANIPGIPVVDCASATLELALFLQPNLQRVAVITGSSPRDVALAEQLRRESPAFDRRIAFTWLTNRSMSELRGELSRLPGSTAVIYLTMFQDASGHRFTPRQALDELAPASRAPIYGYYDTYLGHGIVGGSMVPFENVGRKAAQLGLRILAGEDPQAAARGLSHQATPMFDWRQLRRWDISEAKLPLGSVVQFRQVTFWKHYRGWIIAGISVCALEAVLIFVLLANRGKRRRAERSLRESEARFRVVADAAPVLIWMSGTDKLCTFFNRPWLKFTGRRLEQELGNGWADGVHPADLSTCMGKYVEAFDHRQPFEIQYRLKRHDGEYRSVTDNGVPRYDEGGNFAGYVGCCVDVTERKRAESEASQHRQELAFVSRLNLAGELSGALAHELGQPLGAMLANTDSLELHLAQASPDLNEVRTILADVRSDIVRAGEIVHGMRAFLGRHEADFELLDVRSLMLELEKLAGSDAALRQASLTFLVAPELPPINGNRVHLQQVVLNLILNGLQAMESCAPAERRLSVTATARNGDEVEIAVADTGHGVPSDKLKQVFTPFFTTKPAGLGLGLSICRRIIEAHGGSISIENNAQRGATAHFTLPFAQVKSL